MEELAKKFNEFQLEWQLELDLRKQTWFEPIEVEEHGGRQSWHPVVEETGVKGRKGGGRRS